MSQSEELQSANEELQSTNEELQTSNEELQSTNEELLTVNDEMQSKSQELARLAGDLHSIKESLDFPMLVCDERLHVKHFNRTADKALPKEGLQIDISLASIDWHVDMVGLLPTIKNVIRSGNPEEVVANDEAGHTYTVRVMPASDEDTDSRTAVMTFIDISSRAAAESALKEREMLYRLSFEKSALPMCVLKRNLQFTKANAAMCRLLNQTEPELLEQILTDRIHDPENREWRIMLDELVHGERSHMEHDMTIPAGSDGDERRVRVIASHAFSGPSSLPTQINVQVITLG